MTNGALWDAYAIGFGLILAGVVGLFYAVRSRRGPRPYDWERDGEADNRSHPRILS
jgi:hypothetical protein